MLDLKSIRGGLFALAAAGLLLAVPGTAHAQGLEWDLDGWGGIGVPAGDFADLPIDDLGPAFGLGIAYHVSPRVDLRADGALELYSGEGAGSPDVNLWHYTGGAEVEITDPRTSRWEFTANLNAGATTLDTDRFTSGGASSELSETYFAANGGLNLGYDVSRQVNVYVGGQYYLTFSDEEDTAALAGLSPQLAGGFDTISTFPLYAGLKVEF